MATKMTKVSPPVEKTEVSEVKKYEKEDLIPCRSVCNGRLFIEGVRSHIMYQWADYGDVVDVEYQDLIYMIHSSDKNITEPRFVIEDEDIIAQNKTLDKIYSNMFTQSDYREILNLPISAMRDAIDQLPKGAKNSIKGIASTMIDNGSLDSVQKIKVIDEIFGTRLLLTLAQS